MEGLQVLTQVNVHGKLDELAPVAELPWALIKSKVLEFADALRFNGVFFVFSDDPETINKLQEKLTENKAWTAGLPQGSLFIHPRESAKAVIDAYGKKFIGVMWSAAKPHMNKFLDVLYTYNCFVASGDENGAKFLDLKTREKNVSIRIKG
jgi:hypothetical protein